MLTATSGTHAFLFTDIEGSTRRWESDREAMSAALARHDAILRAVIEANGGTVFKTVGDAFCAAFVDPVAAVRAALDAQLALGAEDWSVFGNGIGASARADAGPPDAGGGLELNFAAIRVRMALHSGLAEEREGDYFGPTLNRVARLLSAGHGGQVLVSAVTEGLLGGHLPSGVTLRDLGEHRLKDLARAERVWQLAAEGLVREFPSLTTLDARPHNLPVQLTSFVGREAELAELVGRLQAADGSRLLTLLGPGGTGKTRLALQAAAELLGDFTDGVWFVDLAPLADGAQVLPTVAASFGLRDEPGRPLDRALSEHLRPKRLLLVLDNCEHLIETCAGLTADLLRAAAGLNILATSREPLGVPGEVHGFVEPMPAPDPARLAGHLTGAQTADLARFDAVRLFVERAAAVRPGFQVTGGNAAAIAEICHRLDGIPLALELAAARVHALAVEEIARRLDQRLRLLTGGSRTLPPRQQTLRAAIDWSYELLGEEDRRVLERLAVFAGAIRLDAAEVVCAGGTVEDWAVMDTVLSLVSRSLVAAQEGPDGGFRYRLLETIRTYALEALAAAGDEEGARDRHLAWYVGLAEEAEPQLVGSEPSLWLQRLERQHDNLRTALAWGLAPGLGDRRRLGTRLALALPRFWTPHSHYREMCRWLDLALAAVETTNDAQRRARVAYWCAAAHTKMGDLDRAEVLHLQAIEGFEEQKDQQYLSWAVQDLATVHYHRGDFDTARPMYLRALSLKRALEVAPWDVGITITLAAEIARCEGNWPEAVRANREALALTDGAEPLLRGAIRLNLAFPLLRQGDIAMAGTCVMSAIGEIREAGSVEYLSLAAAAAAAVAAIGGETSNAARLFGASHQLSIRIMAVISLADQRDIDHFRDLTAQALPRAEWLTLLAEGQALEEDDIVALALRVLADA